jgi:hypothetical protein
MSDENSDKIVSLRSFATMDHSPTEKAPFWAFMRCTSFCKRFNNVAENHEVRVYFAFKVRED